MAGRYVVLCFLGSAKDADSQTVLQALDAQSALFDADHLMLFHVFARLLENSPVAQVKRA